MLNKVLKFLESRLQPSVKEKPLYPSDLGENQNIIQSSIDSLKSEIAALKNSTRTTVSDQPRSIYLGDGELLVQTKHFKMIVPGWDLSLTPTILLNGDWEPHLTNYFMGILQPGMVALDVGANMGWFASLFAYKGAIVHSFEPNPRLQRVLKKNIFLNAEGNTPQCSVNMCAVGETCTTAKMKFPHWLVGGASFENFDQSTFLDSLIDEEIDTPVITLDEFAKQQNIEKIDILKIDIEGFEEQAVLGAKQLIANSPDIIVVIEYTRGRYSSKFPSYMFSLFSKAFAPGIGKDIDLQFLQDYENQLIHQNISHIDIIFRK